MSNETNLAKRIKELKEQNQMTNQELADRSGLPLSNVSKLLSGVTQYPTIDTVAKLATALNISIDYLVYGNESPLSKTRSKDEFQLIESYRSLSQAGKHEIIKYIALLTASNLYTP